MYNPEFSQGQDQFENDFAPEQPQIEGEIDLRPPELVKMEKFVIDTALDFAGENEALREKVLVLLESYDPRLGQNYGGLAEQAIDADGNEIKLKERLASAALKSGDDVGLEEVLEHIVEVARKTN